MLGTEIPFGSRPEYSYVANYELAIAGSREPVCNHHPLPIVPIVPIWRNRKYALPVVRALIAVYCKVWQASQFFGKIPYFC